VLYHREHDERGDGGDHGAGQEHREVRGVECGQRPQGQRERVQLAVVDVGQGSKKFDQVRTNASAASAPVTGRTMGIAIRRQVCIGVRSQMRQVS
jgi:hypothetical protein